MAGRNVVQGDRNSSESYTLDGQTSNQFSLTELSNVTSDNINSKGESGWTPVMRAAVSGNLKLFNLLLGTHPDLTLVDDAGNSLLHLACQGGNREIVQQILTPSNLDNRGKNGLTPVMKAAAYGQEKVFDFLVSQKANLSFRTSTGDNILHLACQGGNKELVEQVLQLSDINTKGENGWTPIMNAAIQGHQGVFEFLISKTADLTLLDDHGNPLLHLACQGGNRDIVKAILTPSNMNSKGRHNWTPIMRAAVTGQPDVFDFLVSKNADLTMVDDNGSSVLHMACQGGNTNTVQSLLTSFKINSKGTDGCTPVMIAAVNAHLNVFNVLVKHNADLSMVDDYMDSLLHLACRGGNKDIVCQVLTPNNLNSRGKDSMTPVMVAASCGHLEVFNLLVLNNADLKLTTDGGDTLLHLASFGGKREIVEQVVLPSNINGRGEEGATPIMNATSEGHQNVFELLVSQNADLTLENDLGDTLFEMACHGGNRHIVEFLLTPFNINQRGRHGWTPIMIAVDNDREDVFELLLSHKADLAPRDEVGNTVMHLACRGNNIDIIKKLLTPSNINLQGENELTPVMTAAAAGQRNVFFFLLAHGADPTLDSPFGDSLLHLACKGGNRDIVQYVFKVENLNKTGKNGWTPIMCAAMSGQLGVFDFLVSHEASLKEVDVDGDSLLHLACQGGYRNIVQHALTACNVNERGEHGWTPVMLSAAFGHKHVFELLVSSNADLSVVDDHGNSLIHLACQGGNIDIVKQVVKPENINKRDGSGSTPIMVAAEAGHQGIYDLLVSHNADLTLVDSDECKCCCCC